MHEIHELESSGLTIGAEWKIEEARLYWARHEKNNAIYVLKNLLNELEVTIWEYSRALKIFNSRIFWGYYFDFRSTMKLKCEHSNFIWCSYLSLGIASAYRFMFYSCLIHWLIRFSKSLLLKLKFGLEGFCKEPSVIQDLHEVKMQYNFVLLICAICKKTLKSFRFSI